MNVITSLVNFLVNSIESLIMFIVNIPTYIAFLVDSINILPAVLIPFIITSIYIFVALFLIGRNN